MAGACHNKIVTFQSILKRGNTSSFFFGVLLRTKIGMSFALSSQYKNFGANKMSTKYLKFLTLCVSGGIPASQFVDIPIVSRIPIFETINKTWHADCRNVAVSKILDWLVK